MSIDPEEGSENKYSAEYLKRAQEVLSGHDEELKRLDEEIQKAEDKSKYVIRHPDP